MLSTNLFADRVLVVTYRATQRSGCWVYWPTGECWNTVYGRFKETQTTLAFTSHGIDVPAGAEPWEIELPYNAAITEFADNEIPASCFSDGVGRHFPAQAAVWDVNVNAYLLYAFPN